MAVSARDRNRDRGFDMANAAWFDDPVQLAAKAEIDVFVELVGGSDGAAHESVKAALSRGLPVVTANKALLAHHGVTLAKLAARKDTAILFEAAVAGGIPIVKTMREGLSGNAVSRVYGILNGTCNYMLTRMEREGISFGACLADAQSLGYAEADPTFDIGGFDAAHKLAILTSLAFGCEIDLDSVFIEGISAITNDDIQAAAELGYRIKLLAVAQRTDTGIEQRVHPAMIPASSALAQVRRGHQCRGRRHRSSRFDPARGSWSGRRRDRLGGPLRHHGRRRRCRPADARAAGRQACALQARQDARPRRRLLHPPCGPRQGRRVRGDRAAHGRSEDFARIDPFSASAIVRASRAPKAAPWRRWCWSPTRRAKPPSAARSISFPRMDI